MNMCRGRLRVSPCLFRIDHKSSSLEHRRTVGYCHKYVKCTRVGPVTIVALFLVTRGTDLVALCQYDANDDTRGAESSSKFHRATLKPMAGSIRFKKLLVLVPAFYVFVITSRDSTLAPRPLHLLLAVVHSTTLPGLFILPAPLPHPIAHGNVHPRRLTL